MTNADVARIVNSDEIQSVVKTAKEAPKMHMMKKNALKNKTLMKKLNPAAASKKRRAQESLTEGTKEYTIRNLRRKKNEAETKKHHKGSKAFYNSMMQAYAAASKKKEPAAEEENDEE